MKILLAPTSRDNAFIVGDKGQLRVIDPPCCKGYVNCCVCPECIERLGQEPAPTPARQPWETAA